VNFRKPSIVLPNFSVHDAAQTYFNAGNLLYMQPPGKGFYLPAANLFCHSIELFLKSLINPINWAPSERGVYVAKTAQPSARHALVDMWSEVEDSFKKELSAKRGTIQDDLHFLEGFFQATRYAFEDRNIERTGWARVVMAHDVARFFSNEVPNLQ